MRLWRGGSELPALELRVIVAEAGLTKVSTEQADLTLDLGDVVVLEPKDGRARLIAGSAVVLTEPAKVG
jgi:hypothetical protein